MDLTSFAVSLLQPLIVVPVIVISVVAKLSFFIGFAWHLRPTLSKIPGPRFAALSRLWLVKVLASCKSQDVWVAVNKKHGKLARVGPNHVMTSCSDTTRRLLAVNSGYLCRTGAKSARAGAFTSIAVGEVHEQDSEYESHQTVAEQISKFKIQYLHRVEPALDKLMLSWIDLLTGAASESCRIRPFNIATRVQYLTIDLVTKLHLGYPVGCIANDGDVHHLLDDIERRSSQEESSSILPQVKRYASIAAEMLGFNGLSSKSGLTGICRLEKLLTATLADMSSASKNASVVAFLTEQGMPRDKITADVISSIIAGVTIIPTAINAIILAIITNPVAYQMLTAEIRSTSRSGNVSEPIQDNETNQFPYLQACVLEGLRKHPPMAQFQDRVVPHSGDYIGAFRVPAGTQVSFNVWGMQLDREVYGPDADAYRPSRWLTDDEAQLKRMYMTHNLMFSHGMQPCFSTDMTMTIVHKVVFEVFRHFDAVVANPYQPWESTCHNVFFQKRLDVYLTPVTDHELPAYDGVSSQQSSRVTMSSPSSPRSRRRSSDLPPVYHFD